jgi:capsule polysaccharide export protein KpsE/RkpR
VLAFVGEEQADDPEKQIRSWSVTIDNIGKSKKAADLRSLAYDRLKSEAQAAKDNLAAAVKSKREDHIEAATARMARWFDPDSAVDA